MHRGIAARVHDLLNHPIEAALHQDDASQLNPDECVQPERPVGDASEWLNAAFRLSMRAAAVEQAGSGANASKPG